MRRVLAVALSVLMMVGGLGIASASAATVKKGAACSGAVGASVRGTSYVCQNGTWQVVARTVRAGGGCTYKAELARSGSTLMSCVPRGRTLSWVRASQDCNAANRVFNRVNATYNQTSAQVTRIEAQIQGLSGTDAQTIRTQLSTIKTNLATIQSMIKDSRTAVLQTCSKA